MRKKELERIIRTGKTERKTIQGHQRITKVDSLSTWCGMSATELLRTTNDRADWRAMT